MKMLSLAPFLLLLLFACSEGEEFTTPSKQENFKTEALKFWTTESCSNFTRIRPKVDFLFVWDNSTSTFFINEQTKRALRETITLMSDRFDYHILLAPLIESNPTNPTLFLLADNNQGLSGNAFNYLTGLSQVQQRIDLFSALGFSYGLERGFQRTIDLLNNNRSNGIFRQDAYTMIVLMSNGDDEEVMEGRIHPVIGHTPTRTFLEKKAALLNIKQQLRSIQFRFISLTAHQANAGACQNFRIGAQYRAMSSHIYIDNLTNSNGSPPNDQTGRIHPDSYDICSNSGSQLFNGPNDTIRDVIVGHEYQFWLAAPPGSPSFNPNAITVNKKVGTQTIRELLANDPNGFELLSGIQTRNSRIFPTSGEPVTGHLIELKGNGRVIFPECLRIRTQSPTDYYGFIALESEPRVDSIKVTINGEDIPSDLSNGWEYIGFRSNINLKIQDPGNPNIGGTPGLFKSGYILRVHGNAIYSNNSEVQVRYIPQ